MTPNCPYCRSVSEKVHGGMIYQHRPDLAHKTFYRCEPCSAWVGCHPGTAVPLGRLANAELRAAKSAVHAAFDPLWKAKMRKENCSKHEARGKGYQWLASQLGIEAKDCHIGMFDVGLCERAVAACRPNITTGDWK